MLVFSHFRVQSFYIIIVFTLELQFYYIYFIFSMYIFTNKINCIKLMCEVFNQFNIYNKEKTFLRKNC